MMNIKDGKDAWRFKLPDGRTAKVSKGKYNQEQAGQIMREQWGVKEIPQTSLGKVFKPLGNTPDLMGSMNPLGLRDEVEGAGRYVGAQIGDLISGKDENKPYSHYRDQVKAELEIKKFLSPKADLALNIVGGMGMFGPGKNLATSAMGEAGVSAVIAGAEGLASGDNTMDRAFNGVTGMLLGGTLGLVIPSAGRGLMNTAAWARKVLESGVDAAMKNNAVNTFMKQLERDGISPARLLARMKQMGDEAMTMDAGGANVQGGARALQAAPGPGKQTVKTSLERRQNSQPERVSQAIGDSMDASGGFDTSIATAIERRALGADEAYGELNGTVSMAVQGLKNFTSRPAIQSAFASASRIAKNSGVSLPDTLEDALKNGASFDTWNTIKKGLDDVIYGARRTGMINDVNKGQTSLGAQEMASMQKLRAELLDELDAVYPGYRQARDAFSGETRLIEAAELGRRFAKNDFDLSTEALSKMSASEREMYRNGVGKALDDIMDQVIDGGNVVRRIFGKKDLRNRIRAGFESDSEFRAFTKKMLGEAELAKTNRAVLGGSDTARIQAETKGLLDDLSNAGIDLITSGGVQAAKTLGRKLFGDPKLNEAQSKAMAQVVTAKYPQAKQMLHNAQIRSKLSGGATSAAGQFGGIQGGLLAQPYLETME